MSFLYFAVESATAGVAKLPAALAYIAEGRYLAQHVARGPGERPGTLYASHRVDPAALRYQPQEQTWKPLCFAPGGAIARDAYWIGHAAVLPAASDVARAKMIPGRPIELGDGKPWQIPLGRAWIEEEGQPRWTHTLPRREQLGPEGRWQRGEVRGEYRRLWDLACRWFDQRIAAIPAAAVEGQTLTMDFQGLREAAAEVLAVNYRLGPEEISLLNLFDGGCAVKILDALADWETFVALAGEMEKKTASIPPAG